MLTENNQRELKHLTGNDQVLSFPKGCNTALRTVRKNHSAEKQKEAVLLRLLSYDLVA
jgi:hypothetical protein